MYHEKNKKTEHPFRITLMLLLFHSLNVMFVVIFILVLKCKVSFSILQSAIQIKCIIIVGVVCCY